MYEAQNGALELLKRLTKVNTSIHTLKCTENVSLGTTDVYTNECVQADAESRLESLESEKKVIIGIIDKAKLNMQEQQFILARFECNKKISEICTIMHYSESAIKIFRRSALKKIASVL